MVVSVSDPFFVKSDRLLVLQLSFHFRCMWEYTTPSHGLPIGAFFRGESARNAYGKNDDYSIRKGNSTVVLWREETDRERTRIADLQADAEHTERQMTRLQMELEQARRPWWR